VRAIATRNDAWQQLPQALAPSITSKRRADLIRAIGMTAERAPLADEQRKNLSTALLAILRTSSDLGYEEYYRLLKASAQVSGTELAQALVEQYATLKSRSDAEGLALLRRVVLSLGRVGGGVRDDALQNAIAQTIRQSMGHTDPGVRLATLSALASKSAPDGLVETVLGADPWPEVRRAAAATLSVHCKASGAAALRTATLGDTNSKVARTAFTGLLRCGGSELFSLALDIVDTEKRPLDLRLQAARMLGDLAPPSQAQKVLERFAKARRSALANRNDGKIASAMTRALADLGSPTAIDALESSAADPAFPQLQAASITALGTLCPKSSQQLFRRLRRSNENGVATAATMAVRRCAK